jgi:hypothetical protein
VTFPQQILVAGAVGGVLCGATVAALLAIVQQVACAVSALEDVPALQRDMSLGILPLGDARLR